MKIQNLKTKVIGPVLLLIPMACMHLGDGHHSGDHHSSIQLAVISIFNFMFRAGPRNTAFFSKKWSSAPYLLMDTI